MLYLRVYMFDETTEKDNEKAFERLLDEKESLDDSDLNRYRYYEDLYNNQYRWYTHKQKDGKFKAIIKKARTSGSWLYYDTKKEKSFVKRKTAKAWCLKHYLKAKEHQREVINAREERKQKRLDAKPKYTKEETAIRYAGLKIRHYQELQARADKKIRVLTTRKKTYQKRINYYEKRILKLGENVIETIK